MSNRLFFLSLGAAALFLVPAMADEGGGPEPIEVTSPLMPALPSDSGTDASQPLSHPNALSTFSQQPLVHTSSASSPAQPRHLSTLDPHVTVTKIHEVRNDLARHQQLDEDPHTVRNDALEFEQEYWNYGAITQEEKAARRGQIYVISWRNTAPADDFTVRFEYRQQNSHDQVKAKTLSYSSVKGNVRSIFMVVGDEYHKDGPVEGWCLSILRNGRVVGQEKSFIW